MNKLSNIKIGKKTTEQKEVINNVEKFDRSREEVINFFRDYMQNKMNVKEQDLNIKTKTDTSKITKSSDNNSGSLLNEIRQIVYSFYQSKQTTKKVYNSIIKSIYWNYTQIHVKMNTIFMNLENSRTSKPHILILKLTSKLDLRISEKLIALSNQVFVTHVET